MVRFAFGGQLNLHTTRNIRLIHYPFSEIALFTAGSAPSGQDHPMIKARTTLATVSVVATLALSAAGAAHAASEPDRCFAGWSDAVPVVTREALTPARDLHAQARLHNIGDVVRIKLCSEDGRFVYQLLVHKPLGRVVRMTVDAHHPFTP